MQKLKLGGSEHRVETCICNPMIRTADVLDMPECSRHSIRTHKGQEKRKKTNSVHAAYMPVFELFKLPVSIRILAWATSILP
jgi:hypothetical protein